MTIRYLCITSDFVLFGSQLKGKATDDSDLDVLIVKIKS
ncbi:MAG: nucleotidyltransferase domain-containing protein [Bacteroidales bacterium]|nr:nucleotidyltransferase domain-containing protein [Bacteroidales bacterium]